MITKIKLSTIILLKPYLVSFHFLLQSVVASDSTNVRVNHDLDFTIVVERSFKHIPDEHA